MKEDIAKENIIKPRRMVGSQLFTLTGEKGSTLLLYLRKKRYNTRREEIAPNWTAKKMLGLPCIQMKSLKFIPEEVAKTMLVESPTRVALP